MFAVSLHPTPLRWTLKVVPTGPRATSSGNAVSAAEIVRCLEPEFDVARGIRHGFRDHPCILLPAAAGHAVAGERPPFQRDRLAGRETVAAHHYRLADACEARHRDELAGLGEPVDMGLRLCRRRGRQHRGSRRDGVEELELRPVGGGRLLLIAVGKGEVGVDHLEHVAADAAGRRDRHPRAARRGHRRHPAGVAVVVEQDPAVLELAIAIAVHLDLDRRTRRSAVGEKLHGHVDVEGVLREQAVALLQHDVVLEAEVIGRREGRSEAAGGVALHGRDPVGDRREGAPEIFRSRDLPASGYGRPGEIE
jgi:hypothetical protein